jgi:hypothetical protein
MSPDSQQLLDRAAATRAESHNICLEAEKVLESTRSYLKILKKTLEQSQSDCESHNRLEATQTSAEAIRT